MSDAAVEPPVDFRITLPPGWVRLPLDERLAATVARISWDRAASLPVGQQEVGRQALARLLHEAARAAQSAGGIDVLLSIEPVNGLPVPASCLISYLEAGADGHDSLEAVALQLGGAGVQTSVVQLDAGTAVRRVSSRYGSVAGLLGADEVQHEGPPVLVSEVGYWLRVPGRDGLLALTFSTMVEELAEALGRLFDAMAQTFWWVPA